MMAVPGNVIYFAGYDWLRTSKMSPIEGRVSDTYAPLAAGSLARVLAAIAVSPIEMLRTRMQAHQSEERNVLRATVVELRQMVGGGGGGRRRTLGLEANPHDVEGGYYKR
jgi:solute carrier family 25 protein 39/40